jgi:hypothetical protein
MFSLCSTILNDTRKKFSQCTSEHIPRLVCLQQFCSQCENETDIIVDCVRCGKRRHSFFYDPVGDLLTYLCKIRAWCDKLIAVEHNAGAFYTQFIINRAIFLNWRQQVIMNGLKVVCLRVKHLTFLDSASYLAMPLRKLPEAFGLTARKSWYTHYFNT